MPTVLKDSGELIQPLENTVLPDGDFLVTADVALLYPNHCPNVDTKKALIAHDLLLREAEAPETPLLIQLARLVFENNYLSSEFSPDISFSSKVWDCYGHSFFCHSGKRVYVSSRKGYCRSLFPISYFIQAFH